MAKEALKTRESSPFASSKSLTKPLWAKTELAAGVESTPQFSSAGCEWGRFHAGGPETLNGAADPCLEDEYLKRNWRKRSILIHLDPFGSILQVASSAPYGERPYN